MTFTDRDVINATFELLMSLAEKLTGERPEVKMHHGNSDVWVATTTSPFEVVWIKKGQ